jgi:hypothetical protein
MPTFRKKKYKTAKVRAFLLFLFLATFFWGLTKFSQDYTASIQLPISYTNLPDETLLGANNIDRITFDLTANGFDFLLYKIRKPTIEINVSNYPREADGQVVLSQNEMLKEISIQLRNDLGIKNISINELSIHLEDLMTKKVPIKTVTDISFKEGYKSINGLILIPDSVTVSGSSSHIENIDSVATQTFKRHHIESDISELISLQHFADTNIKIEPKTVEARLVVEEFAQKQVTVAVRVINVPALVKIKIIPSEVIISFDISLEKFNTVTKKDFVVLCDYNERNKEQNFMRPMITESPDDIMNIEMNEKKIDFLIFK